MESVVIIGGGVAGLSCLNALLDHDVSPLLLEGSYIGKPKVCGEFLTPGAVTLLQHWGIGPINAIRHATFFAKNRELNLSFSPPAGAFNREQAEKGLAERAQKKGGRMRENALIVKMKPATSHSPYIFELATGEEIHAKAAIFATGKYNQAHSLIKSHPYFGIKMHFPHVVKPATLIMHSHAGAYFGIVPISENLSNVACLVKREAIEKAGSCRAFWDHLVESYPLLRPFLCQPPLDWLDSGAPSFQLRKTPAWINSYWIGDALASFPPAIGSGFSHSISSALLAANAYLQDNASFCSKKIKQRLGHKMAMANLVHQLLLAPNAARAVAFLLRASPWLANWCVKKLVYSPRFSD